MLGTRRLVSTRYLDYIQIFARRYHSLGFTEFDAIQYVVSKRIAQYL